MELQFYVGSIKQACVYGNICICIYIFSIKPYEATVGNTRSRMFITTLAGYFIDTTLPEKRKLSF